MLGGVCGGLGRYLSIDSNLIRLFFVLLTLGNGVGFWIYVILWIVLPAEPFTFPAEGEPEAAGADFSDRARLMGEELGQAIRQPNPQAAVLIGASLIIVGGIVLIDNLNISWLWWLDFDVLWPALLILGGLALIARRAREA
jgi:phage shock protein PspC (stress-responsive transcriptional regulator)